VNIGADVEICTEIHVPVTKECEEEEEEEEEEREEAAEEEEGEQEEVEKAHAQVDNQEKTETQQEAQEEKEVIQASKEETIAQQNLTESGDLRLKNSTNQTIHANLTELASQANYSSLQFDQSSVHPVHVSNLEMTAISNRTEQESLQESLNVTAHALADHSKLKFAGLSLILVLITALLF